MNGFTFDKSNGKLPPYCVASEQAILGSIMLNSVIMNNLTVSSKHFYSKSNKDVFSAIERLSKAGQHIDMITVCDELRKRDLLDKIGGELFVGELMTTVPNSVNWKSYENIVIEKYNRRTLIKKLDDASESLYNENTDVFKVKESIESSHIESTKFGFDNSDILSAIADKVDRIAEGDTPLFKTGIDPIDENLGGFGQGNVITIGAPSSGGKSAFAAQLINFMAKKEPVLYFSMEMTIEQIAQRWVAQESKYSNKYLQSKAYEDEKDMVGMVSRFLDERTIKFDRSSDYKYILQSIRHHIYQSDVKLVVIDYLQMIRYNGQDLAYEPKNISSVMNGLKEIALDNDICIVMLSQLNEKLEYFGASVIRNASDTCFKILPPYKDEEDDNGNIKRVLDSKSYSRKVLVDKHRGGEKDHEFYMEFDGDSQMFREYVEDPDNEDGFINDVNN